MLLCPWDSPGKNTGVGSRAIPEGNLPELGIEPMSLTSPALAGGFFSTSATWEAQTGDDYMQTCVKLSNIINML